MTKDYDDTWWNIGADDEKALQRIVQDSICLALDHEYREQSLSLGFSDRNGQACFYLHGGEKPAHLKVFKDGKCVTYSWGAEFCGIDIASAAAEMRESSRKEFALMLRKMLEIVEPKGE